jgi:hypothetical protein
MNVFFVSRCIDFLELMLWWSTARKEVEDNDWKQKTHKNTINVPATVRTWQQHHNNNNTNEKMASGFTW